MAVWQRLVGNRTAYLTALNSRFGYGDGLNWYNYVHGDPVNQADPLGLNGCGLANDAPPTVCGGTSRTSGGIPAPAPVADRVPRERNGAERWQPQKAKPSKKPAYCSSTPAYGAGEYPDIYRRFAELVGRRESQVDSVPLRLVADCLLVGSCNLVDGST